MYWFWIKNSHGRYMGGIYLFVQIEWFHPYNFISFTFKKKLLHFLLYHVSEAVIWGY